MIKFVRIARAADWENTKSLGFDLPQSILDSRVRIFIPRRATEEIDGCLYADSELLAAKADEVARGLGGHPQRAAQLAWDSVATIFDWSDAINRAGSSSDALGIVALGVVEIFNSAAKRIKYPKIHVDTEVGQVRFARAGDKSRRPGSISITDGRQYGSSTWYGRIEVSGEFRPSAVCPDEVVDLVNDFADSPEKFAARQGRHSGSCIFCQSSLEDDRSVAAGYGPTCAKNYGLPWGAASVTGDESCSRCGEVPTAISGKPVPLTETGTESLCDECIISTQDALQSIEME